MGGLIVTEDGLGNTKCSRPYEPTRLFPCPQQILTSMQKEKKQIEEFEKLAKNYAKKSKDDQQLLLEAHLAATVDLTFSHFRAIWHQICKINKKNKKYQAWATRSFPQSARALRSDEPGVVMKSVGDAMVMYRCRPVLNYEVSWNREHNGKCALHFPVWIPNENTTQFLRIEDRNLLPTSRTIMCKNRPRHTVIIVKNGKAYHIGQEGDVERVKDLKGRIKFDSLLKPPRGFNTKIRFENKEVFDQPSLLQMTAKSEHVIEEIVKL